MADKQQKQVQEKALLYQIMNAQLEQLSKQAELLESRMLELETAQEALRELNAAEEGSDVLIPIGGGCYGYGKLTRKDAFMVEIGAGIVKEQTLKDAMSSVEDRKKEVEDVDGKLRTEAEGIRSAMERIGLEFQEMTEKEQKKGGGDITVD
jgi:prefoldin alpha subunit